METADSHLVELEEALASAEAEKARALLRRWLSLRAGSEKTSGSVGALLATFAQSPNAYADVASMIVRCSSIDGVLEPNSSNKIARSAVTLVEGALPGLAKFLRFDDKTQNYQKYDALTRTHNFVAHQLDPIRVPYGNLTGMVEARKAIVGSMSHIGLKEYLKSFGLDDLRATVTKILNLLRKVSDLESTLPDDIEACQEEISRARLFSDQIGTFLSKEYFTPFLNQSEIMLKEFLEQEKGRFAADITLPLRNSRLKKRYPLHETGREFHISVPLRNSGPGRAKDLRISCSDSDDSIIIDSMECELGSIAAGDFEVTFNCLVSAPCKEIHFTVSVEWGEIGTAQRQSDEFLVNALAQSADLDWSSLEYTSPYSTEVAEGDAFVGRHDRVKQLAGKLLRTPMEPFYVTGQKRVGKTSLAMAASEFAKSHATGGCICSLYILWGSVAATTPAASIRRLGEEIHEFIAAEFPTDVIVPVTDYSESLSDLLKLARLASQVVPSKRFLVILDEIDEIHEELYLSGGLAATFFANLRALSRASNIGLVLIGGENMPYVMDRQGQKLNNFSRINLSSYHRGSEWNDFRLLVTAPTEEVLHWHEDAVSEVYNASSGNPYFAKLICAAVFDKAHRDRDADITVREVKIAIAAAISTLGANSFAHLWQDGIHRSVDEREPEILRRLRVLVALARCLRNGVEPTSSNIAKNKATSALSDEEVRPMLHDFNRRGILQEEAGCFELVLPLFHLWLVDVGAGLLAADEMSQEIADSILERENRELVSSAEIVHLTESWPTYCGQRIGTDEVRAWIEQVPSKREQRILFQLLSRMRVYGEPLIREKLKALHDVLRRTVPVPVQTRRNQRRNDILVTYVDGPAKSGASYAALYAEENRISSGLVVAPGEIRTKFEQQNASGQKVNAIVVVDDIAATGGTFSELLTQFAAEHRTMLKETKLRAFAVVATQEGEDNISKTLRKFSDLDIEFNAAEPLSPSDRAFPRDSDVWDSRDRRERAEALCRDLGSRIYKKQPFGVGGLGLLVVFPTTVPNNTLPIIHSASKDAKHPWKPLFRRPVN